MTSPQRATDIRLWQPSLGEANRLGPQALVAEDALNALGQHLAHAERGHVDSFIDSV